MQTKNAPMNAILHISLDAARRQIQGGVASIHEGFSLFKDDLNGIYGKAKGMLSNLTQPVNNFIKDLTQIEMELRAELADKASGPSIIPLDEALKVPMEENY